MKNHIYIFATILLAVSFLSVNFFVSQSKTDFSEKHLIIVLRNIGHQLLLRSADSTSRILPIKKIYEKTFQIEFQNQFVFSPDTLVSLVDKNLKSGNLPNEYIVNVLNSQSKEMIFGYEVSNKTNNILPCLGRKLPRNCYIIQLEFLEKNVNYYAYFLLIFPLGLLFYFFRKNFIKNKKTVQLTDNEAVIKIGNFSFFAEKQFLKHKSELIELSERESKLLKIFAENQNQLIEREKCLKEIWEDEGTIVVGRSLDVLVSKLRKKLILDEAIKIINIHGKGYKMTVD